MKEKRSNFSFLGWSLVFILSCFAFGAVVSWVLANQLLGLSFAPSSDRTTFNFEESIQGWEIGKSPAGKLLGKSLETSTEEAYTGARSLKYKLDLELEDTITGIGRVYSPPQFRSTELVVAYVWLPNGAPTNIGVSFFQLSSPGQQNASSLYIDDLESEFILQPGDWNILLWDIPSADDNLDVSIGLKFCLIPMEGNRRSLYDWGGDIYIDSIQVIKRPEGSPPIVMVVPTETPAPGATEVPPTSTPSATETLTSMAPTATHVPIFTPTPTFAVAKNIGVVIPGSLNMRAGPDVFHEVVGVLYQGDTVTILGQATNGWLYIRAESGLEGWVNGKYLDIKLNLGTVPITATPTLLPAPTLVSPKTIDKARFQDAITLDWEWFRELENGEWFSLRVGREQEEVEILPCLHTQFQDSEIFNYELRCPTGRYYWEVVVAVKNASCPEGWCRVSEVSDREYFDYVVSTPPPPTLPPDTPEPTTRPERKPTPWEP